MRLRALLDTDALGLRLLGGEDELDRTVRGVMTTDLRDPSRYLGGGELVLTGLAWRRDAADTEPFVRILATAGVAALAAGEAELGDIPDDLVEACARHRLPLFAVNESVAFATITEHVVRQVSGERAGDLAAVVDRHRRLMTSGPAGGGPDVVLDLLGSDLDLRAWVLSPAGRAIAGAAAGAPGLSARIRARLAGEHLAAARTGRRGPHRVGVDGVTYSLFPIRSSGRGSAGASRDVRETVLSDWLLAVEADAGDWPEERLDLLQGVTQLIAVERDRRDAARTVRRRLAQEVLELVQTGAAPAEIAARLRVAAPVLLPGLGAAPHWQVVVARVEWDEVQGGPAADAGGRRAGEPSGSSIDGGRRAGIESGPVAQALLEEILVDPATAGPDPSDRIAVAHTGDEAIALVPLPAMSPEAEGGDAGLLADALLAAVREPLTAGLADDGRLTLGVSAAVHSAEGLRGALEEARHARRVAAARPGRVCAAGHQELASHVLLLPFVPDDVRRAFTARLLDPLREYDRRHRAELIPTLEAFLDCDGSWTRCATRLHLHVNTLRYRVGRIEQLTGRDLARLEDKLDFFLALRMS
ncbi:carbohydrate diacid transcriptional activator CdaR [Streptomyces sp. YIM 121038]|uniref:PucR family transcriptional regulator ligand-binding domain-containing protein n=1 Tax=Streptomyces sp. YIM 121038 TaxID=2136401 RepID=UPI0011104BA2|nr:PucR family transcriptional regulator ligand-binding domain-containing protein [Streptomyces sp. YIM 121038]QCX79838.1 carbohydrate diacid transcriptional activator CdaR [Streptomyces sp. YIM 121038]